MNHSQIDHHILSLLDSTAWISVRRLSDKMSRLDPYIESSKIRGRLCSLLHLGLVEKNDEDWPVLWRKKEHPVGVAKERTQ